MLGSSVDMRVRLPARVTSGLVGHTVAEIECELLLHTLAFYKGCRTQAAKACGISMRTLRNKIREYEAAGRDVPSPAGGSRL